MSEKEKATKNGRKTLLFVGGVLVIGTVFFITKLNTSPASGVKSSSTLANPAHGVNGGNSTPMTEEYEKKVVQENDRVTEEAQAKGNSALPVLTAKTDPQKNEVSATAKTRAQIDQNYRQQYEQERSRAMVAMVKDILAEKTPEIRTQSYENQLLMAGPERSQTIAVQASKPVPSAASRSTLAQAGTVWIADLVTPVDTDSPAVVLADIASGPFSGGRMIGRSTKKGDYVEVQFSTLSHGGRSYSANAVAVNMDDSRALLSGEVDRKLFQRYMLPILGNVVAGAGAAMAQASQTTSQTVTPVGGVTTSTSIPPATERQILGSAIGSGAVMLSNRVVSQNANVQPAVKVNPGQIGILLLSDLQDAALGSAPASPTASQAQMPVFPMQLPQPAMPVVGGQPQVISPALPSGTGGYGQPYGVLR